MEYNINKYQFNILLLILALILSGCTQKSLVKNDVLSKNSELPPRKAINHYLRALNFEEDRFYQGALVEYRQAAFLDTGSIELKLGILRNYYRLEILDSAVVTARRIINKSPENEEALALLGQSLVEKKSWEEACTIFIKLIAKYPDNIAYSAHLAAIYLEMKKPGEAAEVYRNIADKSDNPSAIYERAGTIMLINNYDDFGLQLLNHAVELNPSNHTALHSIGTIFIQSNRPDSALYYFHKAMSVDPEEPKYPLSAAFAMTQLDDFTGAENTLSIAIEKFPDVTQLYNLLGSVLQNEKKYSEALSVLYKSIEIDSTDTSPYVTIGYIYDELDSLNRAVEIYNKALSVDSTDALVLNNYAYLLAEANIQLDYALSMASKALEKSPDNPSYLDTMGWLLFRLQNYGQAEDYIRKALDRDQNPVMYLHLGDILKQAGRPLDALEIYRKGLEIEPGNIQLKLRLENN